jgi:hypothetical protein
VRPITREVRTIIGPYRFVAISHIGFLVLEMFFWDHPLGRKIFNMTPEASASSRVLAANQGLYNGFLAAGLAWGIWSGPKPTFEKLELKAANPSGADAIEPVRAHRHAADNAPDPTLTVDMKWIAR